MFEFEGKTYKTIAAKDAAITKQRNARIKTQEKQMLKLDNDIEVRYKKDKDFTKEKQDEHKKLRKQLRVEFNKLVDENAKDIKDRDKAIVTKKENAKLKLEIKKEMKNLRFLKIADNKMYSTHHASREERMNKFLNKINDKVLPNTNTRNRQKHDRVALNGAFQEKVIYNERSVRNPVMGDSITEHNLVSIVKKALTDAYIRNMDKNLYIYSNITISYYIEYLEEDTGDYYEVERFTHIESERLTSLNQIQEFANLSLPKLIAEYEKCVGQSGGVYKGIGLIKIQTMLKNKTRAGSYIVLPDIIANKKACINIKNLNDDRCVEWCFHAHNHYDKVNHGSTTVAYNKFREEFIEPPNQIYPIDILNDIPKFEKLNKMKINVFEYDETFENLNIIYNTRTRNINTMNILVLHKNGKEHLVLIKDISKLLRKNSTHKRMNWCTQCLSESFDTVEKLIEHQDRCWKHEAVRCVLPDKYIPGEMILNKKGKLVEKKQEDVIRFSNFQNEFMHPCHITMDFEALLVKVEKDDEKIENTIKTHLHVANSIGLKYSCIHEQFSEPLVIYNDKNEDKLLEKMILEVEKLALKSYKLTQQHLKHNFKVDKKIVKCVDCKEEFKDGKKRVVHHDHITGEYISTICSECNLKKQYRKFIPVLLHNLKGYDGHFIVNALNSFGYKNEDSKNIRCIPSNEEKYISFSKNIKVDSYYINGEEIDIMFEIRFIDTLAFMNSSLSELADNIKKDCKTIQQKRTAFKNISEHFENDEQFEMMISKGIYPYEYIDNYEKFSENKLPAIQHFYSSLNNTHCSEEDYKKAQIVWKKFNCKTFLDYHNLYLSSDVLLLTDIWATFRITCYKIYGLDSNYYYTAPGLSWDAFLKHTTQEWKNKYDKIFEIGLITDMDIYLFVESGIRGGLSQISKRYAKANNQYIPETYDSNFIDEYIIYLDANNLYGGAMISYLPQGNFKWNNEKWNNQKILALKNDATTGYLFEVDIHYPESLHDLHNGYALAAENMKIPNSFLNEWQQENRKDATIEKLCTSFKDKKNYPINYRLLKLYIQLGLEITVKRVLQYDQSNFMASYIMKNTNERKASKNEFEKDFFKLMSNSCYGKTMENVRNRINFKLVSSEKEAVSCRNKKQKFTIFNQNLVGVHLLKTEVKLNKPIFIGQCVLDESKYTMQDFHYNFMLKKFKPENVELLFTDTDSLCYHIKNEDPDEVIKNNKNLFDLSAYPVGHELYDQTNKKELNKMKNESITVDKKGVSQVRYIKEFVALRSKLYAYTQTNDDKEHKKCKGVKSSVVYNDIKLQNYKDALFDGKDMKVKMNTFRSYNHKIYTEEITKTALSRNDDKCYILDDQIHTRTFGHYKNKK